MVFSVVVNCFNNSFKIIHIAKHASSTNSRYDGMFSLNSSCYQLSGIFTFLAMFFRQKSLAYFFLRKKVFTSCSTTLKQTNKKKKPN